MKNGDLISWHFSEPGYIYSYDCIGILIDSEVLLHQPLEKPGLTKFTVFTNGKLITIVDFPSKLKVIQ